MESNKKKGWSLKYNSQDATAERIITDIADALGISLAVARLLYNRGYTNAAEANGFLNVSQSVLGDPFDMIDMQHAVIRLSESIAAGDKITIYGDYDVDGVTSVTLLYTYLRSLGADVDYYIPVRDKEGYGMSLAAIDTIKNTGTSLIVTVDTGITAVKEVEYARSLGMDVIVTDHHECHGELPDACAVVNPHRPDCPYSFKELAGVGVVFKLVCACEIMNHPEIDADACVERVVSEYVDLVAMGTVADVMPLVGENRYIVKRGLEVINDTERVGLAALIDAATRPVGVADKTPAKKRKINSGFISFSIAPRINAAGRISTAAKAVDLLLEEDETVALQKAEELCEINSERQRQENNIAEQAYAMIEEMYDVTRDKVIVLDNDKWQQGIIGIVASRITEKYGLPSILISFAGSVDGEPMYDDVGKGSGRSVKGMNLVGALDYCRDLLVQFGGHELAAGLSIKRCNIDEFRKRINEYAIKQLGEDELGISVEADCEITADEIDLSTAEDIARLEPFGVANPTPQFILKDVVIDKILPMGYGRHVKLMLSRGSKTFGAVYFGMAQAQFEYFQGERIDVLCQLSVNEFRGNVSVQLVVQDVRLNAGLDEQYCKDREKYQKLCAMEKVTVAEEQIPTRAEIADAYKFLRYENMCGRTLFNYRLIGTQLSEATGRNIDGFKLRAMMRILGEINVCEVDEQTGDYFYLEVCKNAAKTNIEQSPTYQRLVELGSTN